MRGAFALALLLALGCGGGLEGVPATEPVGDWSFVRDADSVTLGSGDGTPLRMVLGHPVVVDGDLYLRVMTIFTASDTALEDILSDGRAQLAVDGTVYAGRAVRLESAAEIEPLLPEIIRLSHMQAVAPRWDPEPARYPGTQVRQWFFRFEPDPP